MSGLVGGVGGNANAINNLLSRQGLSAAQGRVKTGKANSMIREKVREMSKPSNAQGTSSGLGVKTSIFDSLKQHSESLQAQRAKSSDTTSQIKKLKYSFKNISSKILKSKTSSAAKQAAGQARREAIRLRNQKNEKGADTEEIDAAIAHAKAMERVAKKKAKHLEVEELAKASGGVGAGTVDDEKEIDEAVLDEREDEDYAEEEKIIDEAMVDEEFEMPTEEMLQMFSELSESLESIDDASLDMMAELNDELAQGMQDMLEDMGLDDLTESIEGAKREMDPADLKMMKIKHRNKEMKEIVKADADYLKAVFDRLEKLKTSGAIPGMSTGNSGAAMPAGVGAVPAMPSGISMPEPTIDVSL